MRRGIGAGAVGDDPGEERQCGRVRLRDAVHLGEVAEAVAELFVAAGLVHQLGQLERAQRGGRT